MQRAIRTVLQRTYSSLAPSYKEVKFQAPWGHIAGKWWGPQDQEPVIAMHGWQENCNAFDPLMKILPPDLSVLALDLPGNGLSSKFQSQVAYNVMEEVLGLRIVHKELKMKKPIKFLCHSYSFSVSFIYAVSYPDAVDRQLVIDRMTPIPVDNKLLTKHGGPWYDRLVDFSLKESSNKEATLDEIAATYRKVARESMSLESAKLLMERATALNPETGLYYITRDPRVEVNVYYSFPNEYFCDLTKYLKCKLLFLKGNHKMQYETPEAVTEFQAALTKSTEVEKVMLDGTHHMHMDKPHLVAPYVLSYLFDR